MGEMIRAVRNVSALIFFIVVLAMSASPVHADSCEDVFFNNCSVWLGGNGYGYECTTSESCSPFFHDCCEQYCGIPYDSQCTEIGQTLRAGTCQCG
jgi:hypothetical protein